MAEENVVLDLPLGTLPNPQDDLDKATEEVNEALKKIALGLVKTEEDTEQEFLTTSIQKHRALLLKFATMAYMKKPSSAMLLSSLISLVGSMEKSVRDDRKEKAIKEEGESNKISFSQIVESLNAIAQGAVITPTFELTNFLLNPEISLTSLMPNAPEIKETELVQGNGLVDIDGNPV